eukprot:gb/GFBE01079549.1/.p1 GENE.gb/GFBE01079549.1/~~gb/GFBE01079549.1/.p1  ORF type:complete len:528 (+),score=52.86 gb/GFBE01079549.1/:1-1584(+)
MSSTSSIEATQQRLLELESLIAQVCAGPPGRPISLHTSHASGYAAPQRPSSGRPQSARSSRSDDSGAVPRPPSAKLQSARPQSARPQSASPSAARPQSARPQSARRRPSDREFQSICDLLGSKMAARFKTINQCLRKVDMDHNGTVDRSELHELFRSFNFPDEQADKFFDYLDGDGRGELDYHVVKGIASQYINLGYPGPRVPMARRFVDAQTPEQRKREADLQRLGEVIGSKAHAKFKNLRDCYRFLDHDKDSFVSRFDCVYFMEVFGFPQSTGHQMYELLAEKACDQDVDYNVFVNTFGHFIQPGHFPAKPRAQRPSSVQPPSRGASTPNVALRRSVSQRHRHAAKADSAWDQDDCHPKSSSSNASTTSGAGCSDSSVASSSVPSSAGQALRRRQQQPLTPRAAIPTRSAVMESGTQTVVTPRPPPGAPSRLRPQTARARMPTQQRHYRGTEVHEAWAGAGDGKKSCLHCCRHLEEDSRSTCEPGTPKDSWNYARRASRAEHVGNAPSCSSSLCSSMEQQWGVIA